MLMSGNPTALFITATPKLFRERRVMRALEDIDELCSLARLGNPMNGIHYASMRPKRWMIKIFFADSEDLMDFERLIRFKGYLARLSKHCKGKDLGVELKML